MAASKTSGGHEDSVHRASSAGCSFGGGHAPRRGSRSRGEKNEEAGLLSVGREASSTLRWVKRTRSL